MTPYAAEIRAWNAANERARAAYRAQPIASDRSGRLPCLGDCGRLLGGSKPYCPVCEGKYR